MEEWSTKEEGCPQLLDLIPKDTVWLTRRDNKDESHESLEEKKLELRLGPPGENWSLKDTSKSNRERDESLLSLGYFSSMASISQKNNNINNENQTREFSLKENPVRCVNLFTSPWSSSYQGTNIQPSQPQKKASSFLQFLSVSQSLPVAVKVASQSQICSSEGIDLKSSEKKVFSSAPPANIAVPNSSQKRTAPASVLGWPPIRSFRKNLVNSCSKPSNDPQNMAKNNNFEDQSVKPNKKGLLVKINMDGVPIGRKVDLNAYNSYEKLSSAVDELFRGLLAGQSDSPADGIQKKQEKEKEIKNLIDGSGEFTLVYEDNEGDKMLVGDIPWHIFISNVKRLRVLKSSELPALSIGIKQEKMPLDSKLK